MKSKVKLCTYFKKKASMLTVMSTKTDNKLKWSNPGVYRIPCECGKVYIGETG